MRRHPFVTPLLKKIPIISTCGGSAIMPGRERRLRAKSVRCSIELAHESKSRETVRRLIELYSSVGETNKAAPLIDQALSDFPNDADMLRFIIKYYEQHGELSEDSGRREAAYPLLKPQTFRIICSLRARASCRTERKSSTKRRLRRSGSAVLPFAKPSLRIRHSRPGRMIRSLESLAEATISGSEVIIEPSTGGQEQKTFRSPYTLSIRATAGQNLCSLQPRRRIRGQLTTIGMCP